MLRTRSWIGAAAVSSVVLTGVSAVPAAAGEPETLAVDFSDRTGAFRGGATGTLYGLGDDGVPTEALLNGAHVTNTSQKAPYGTQHPSGDAIRVEDDFFSKHGKDMYIYVQDYYPDWAYNGGQRPGDDRTYDLADGTHTSEPNGVWDYLEIVEFVADAVAEDSAHPENYVFIPFNEPDGGNWYPDWATQKDQFLADWQASYEKIQEVWERHGLGHARIGGPGDYKWEPGRSADILAFTKANDSLPAVFIWHELGIDNLATYRANFAEYRALEESLGIDPIHVNITEYGMLRDMAVPGQLIQWLSMFEDTKVDAQVAYWNYAGNLSDNSARPGGANAGWWMFKWYGDLEGSDTVTVTSPAPNGVDTLQGIGAIDNENKRATVLWGGTDADVALDLSGLDPAVFGNTVDIEVREAPLTGAEGLAYTPRVITALSDVALSGGTLNLTVPTYDRYAGYQLIITPAQHRDIPADATAQPWSTSAEAESLQLTAAQVYTQDPKAGGGWKFLASGGKDVGSLNQVGSKADWTVEVPAAGRYRLQVIGATPGVPGRHALFVDGQSAETIQYTADLALNDTSRWQYRGSAEVLVDLTAGTHTLSIRTSANGTSRLPNSDITLDKVLLTAAQDERTSYPASTFRFFGGAKLTWTGPTTGAAAISGDQRADLYATAMESGYHDLTIDWAATASSAVQLTVNGQPLPEVKATGAGNWRSIIRAHLVEGINEIEVRSAAGASVSQLVTTRVRDADTATVTVEAEAAVLRGTAAATTLAASTGTNASGGAYVGYVGNGAQNAIAIPRTAGNNTAGRYNVTVYYSNAETIGNHAYNPQVMDRRLDIAEGDQKVADGHFRYTYSWNSFWQRTVPVILTTAEAPLKLYRTDGWAPNIDKIQVSPLTVGTPATVSLDPAPVADTTRPEVALVSPTTAGPFTQLQVKVDATDNVGLQRIVANIYEDGTLVKSTQSAVGGASTGSHEATVTLPTGSYTVKYNAQDLAGNISKTNTFAVTIDATKPTATIKDGASYTAPSGEGYSLISYKLFDAGKIDKVTINGKEKNLTDNTWSDVNYIKPGVFGAVKGVNTMVVHDVAGNTQTYTFTLN